MGFVESMAIEVSAAATPDRPIQQVPFPVLTFDEALERFGSDKPDLRFGMELIDLAPVLTDAAGTPASGFRVFDDALAAGGRVKAIVAPGMASITRREIDELTERAKRFGAKGLAYLALEAGGEVKGPIAKFLADDTQRALLERTGAADGRPDPDRRRRCRGHGRRPGAAPGGARRPAGPGRPERPRVRLGPPLPDVPVGLRGRAAGTRRTTRSPASCRTTRRCSSTASGDPTRPSPEDPAGRARALQYDLALNGWELGGGSIRIHRRDLLERSFLLQGQTLEGMREQVRGVLEAFDYGAPPHGGIALGIDRWAALLADQTNIREVMAFPKTQSGNDPMLEAPSAPVPGQLEELGLRFVGRAERTGDEATDA